MKLVFVIKIKPRNVLLSEKLVIGTKLAKEHPSWCGEWRAVFIDKSGSLLIDGTFQYWRYLEDERITEEEAYDICPEVVV